MGLLGNFATWDTFGFEVIMIFFHLGHILGLGASGHFGLENQTRKVVIIHKDFELYQVFMYQAVLIFSQSMHYSQEELKNSGLEILADFEL